ncbi:hypothetical protein PVIIG_06139 [Plasmodium vivax India VII]|uniref:Pv-fam-c protein n=1 Tax=Plasmodium vivax India VII TaxID=1077284 RepID=A0A0J9SGE1_PLAVI|nr:hypothetical protein PVIIG_06139 [Plasmodium vivax India VII]
MDPGYLKISRIPLKVFYDEDAVQSNIKLPSEQRNIDIIKGIYFRRLLQYIKNKNTKNINLWLNHHENKLKKHLGIMQEKLKEEEHDKYCKNLNYILDLVVQALKKFNDSNEFFRLSHEFDEKSKNILNSYKSLKCRRILKDFQDTNLYIKKIMYDLLDDIEYMLSDQYNPIRTQCLNMIKRIAYRWGILRHIYNTVSDKSIFTLDNNFTLYTISEKLQHLKCNKKPKPPKTVNVDEPKPVIELQSTVTDLLESTGSENGKELSGVEKPESLSFQLDINEDIHSQTDSQPKLDTTYAAASLAGISLFGTILYKVKYHYINEILCKIFLFYVNIMLI